MCLYGHLAITKSVETEVRKAPMLWTISAVMLVLWILGFSLHLGGGFIHLLLLVALIVLIWNTRTGRRPLS